jgi:hypothetical protein
VKTPVPTIFAITRHVAVKSEMDAGFAFTTGRAWDDGGLATAWREQSRGGAWTEA